jgi:uncharacterized lipoprotein YajG
VLCNFGTSARSQAHYSQAGVVQRARTLAVLLLLLAVLLLVTCQIDERTEQEALQSIVCALQCAVAVSSPISCRDRGWGGDDQ